MTVSKDATNSDRFVVPLKVAWWVALGLVAAMATASYLLLQQMMATHRVDEELLRLVNAQKALSQRVILLANAAETSEGPYRQQLVGTLREAVSQFDQNQERLMDATGALSESPEPDPQVDAIKDIFFSRPHHLDYFSLSLAANGRRIVAALREETPETNGSRYLAGRERARLDATVADATLSGYGALEQVIATRSSSLLDAMLNAHKLLYAAKMLLLALVALFILRPMTAMMARRTRELVQARNAMAVQAVSDGLTGLRNRSYLLDSFDRRLNDAASAGKRIAVLQLDLDRFKQVNDTLGHAAGDHVLMKTAERLVAHCRPEDLCVRIGGDEFVVLIANAGDPGELRALTGAMVAALNEPLFFQGTSILPAASIGVALFPVDGRTGHDLLLHADLALYSAKRNGGGVAFFTEGLRADLDRQKRLEHEIRLSIAGEDFVPFFQPQVSVASGLVTGIEALVRWNHPKKGLVAPMDFIPIAEKSNLMSRIGRQVFEKAIGEAASWHQRGLKFGRLALNVSGSELREPDFVPFLFNTLAATGLPHECLALEIVESVILDDEKTGIAAKLREIRAAGIHLELDDFGTGYASLSHVNPDEIDRLKIDRRFVQGIDQNGYQAKIVRAITDLAGGLGIAVIAEGAESPAELDCLLSLGCEEVQGFAIARPMPADAIGAWIEARPVERRAPRLVYAG